MNKEFVPYEESLELKELGFDEPCLFGYNQDDENKLLTVPQLSSYEINSGKNSDVSKINKVTAPLYQQVFRWFRENHGLWQIVMQNTDKDWTYDILPIIGITDYRLFDVFDTYEEAELHCLKKLIKIVKGK